MKYLFIIFLSLILNNGFAQVRDSVRIFKSDKLRLAIQKIDSVGFYKYELNDKWFNKKYYYNDTLFVSKSRAAYISDDRKCLFIGEYTSSDSIHYIDFLQKDGFIDVSINNIKNIDRDCLPQLTELKMICSNPDINEKNITEFYLKLSTKTDTLEFEIKGNLIPDYVRKKIMTLRVGDTIGISDININLEYGIVTLEYSGFFAVKP